jgi:hypothetical protein
MFRWLGPGELIAEVTGARPSTGWISSVIAATGEALADTDALIRAQLMAAYLHVDETSINVNQPPEPMPCEHQLMSKWCWTRISPAS